MGLRPLAIEDLERHTAEVPPPLVGRYRGLDVRVTPPNSQGFVLLAALATIERLGIDPDPFGPDAAALSRVLRAAARDRDRHLADPAAMRVPAHVLLDDGHIAALCDAGRDGLGPLVESPPRRTGDTIGLVTADAEGFAVSLIQSLSWGFGSGILEPSTGILLHNRGAGFTLEPDHPNVLAGGKRPEHTLMPVLAHRDGRLAAVSGSMGGYAQPQLNATSLIRAFDLGMTPLDALAAPRWLVNGMDTEGPEPIVTVERSVPLETSRALEAEGLRLDLLEDLDEAVGHSHLIIVGPDGGFEVATDQRADGAALAS
jgi:gamma-glutamyltranspeptidase/glutathione hydrolase